MLRALSPSVHWAQLHSTKPLEGYPLRRVYDYELLYVRDGDILAQLGEQFFPMSTGKLLLISAGVPHRIEVLTEPKVSFLGIHFDFFDELDIVIDQDIIVKEEAPALQRFCCEPLIEGFAPLSHTPIVSSSPQMIDCMEQLIKEFNLRLPGHELVCKGLLLQLLTLLFRTQRETRKVMHPLYGERMLELALWIDSQYHKDCGYAILAQRVSLNEDYMSKQFKDTLGMSPNKYLQMIRQREAKRLLRETEDTVEEIGKAIGYGDIHYFSRIFHKWEGISPREHRNLSRVY